MLSVGVSGFSTRGPRCSASAVADRQSSWIPLISLGVGGLEPRLSPTPIAELEGKKVLRVACGANHSGAARPVAYVLFARPGVRDHHNFAQEYETLLPRSASEGGTAAVE